MALMTPIQVRNPTKPATIVKVVLFQDILLVLEDEHSHLKPNLVSNTLHIASVEPTSSGFIYRIAQKGEGRGFLGTITLGAIANILVYMDNPRTGSYYMREVTIQRSSDNSL